MYTLKRFIDTSGFTWGFEVVDNSTNIVMHRGDGYPDEDSIITELSSLNEAFHFLFG